MHKEARLIPVVIVEAESQAEKVAKLVQYCRELDGTEVTVLSRVYGTDFPYPHCNNAAFAYAAQAFKGKPFFWIEPDSIPLRPGWLKDLEYEYVKSGMDFMITADAHYPWDMVGGIGIYGPETHWLIPQQFPNGGWDGWMVNHLSDITHRSMLIQHSYGAYQGHEAHGVQQGGVAIPHRFPEKLSIIRPSARIFHRDPFQDLLTCANQTDSFIQATSAT